MNQMTISKSKLKPRILEILRDIEWTRKELIITDHRKPVLKIISILSKTFRGTESTNPTDPSEVFWNARS
jgi:hypothetical protein